MVKRFLLGIVIFCALLVAIAGGLSYFIRSDSGSSWILRNVENWSGGRVSIESSEGSLFDHLVIGGLKIETADAVISIEEIETSCHGIRLFPLRIWYDSLQLKTVRIQSLATEKAASEDSALTWPQLPQFLSWVEIAIDSFSFDSLSIVKDKYEEVLFNTLKFRASFDGEEVAVKDLQLVTDQLQSRGKILVDFARPHLLIALDTSIEQQAAPAVQLSFNTDLSGRSGLPLSGAVAVVLDQQQLGQIDLNGKLSLEASALAVEGVHVKQRSRGGDLVLDAQLTFDNTVSVESLTARLDQLDVSTEAGQQLILSGLVTAHGILDDYAGSFRFSTEAAQLLKTDLAGSFRGDPSQLQIDDFTGGWLDGVLSGALVLNWQNGLDLSGSIAGRGIDPQLAYGSLQGEVTFALDGKLSKAASDPLSGSVSLALEESILQGFPVNGSLRAHLQLGQPVIEKLELNGSGFTVSASGNPHESLQVAAVISHLERLLTDVRGSVQLNGEVALLSVPLWGRVQASGRDLRYQDWILDSFSLQGQSRDLRDRLQLTFDAAGVSNQNNKLVAMDRVTTKLQGDLTDHRLQLTVKRQADLLQLDLEGQMHEDRSWSGEVNGLQLASKEFGDWCQSGTTRIRVSAAELMLDHFALNDKHGSRLSLQDVFYQYSTAEFSLTGNWQQFNLARLNRLLPELAIDGRTDGALSVENRAEKHVRLKARLNGQLEPGGGQAIILDEADVDVNWDVQGLFGSVAVETAEQGDFNLQLSSSQAADFTVLPHGSLQLSCQDVPASVVQPWLPGQITLEGLFSCSGDGRWNEGGLNWLSGRLALDQGFLGWKSADGLLKTAVKTAELDWQLEERLKAGLSLVLENYGSLEGQFSLPLELAGVPVFKKDGEVSARFSADLKDNGLLASLAPEYLDSSKGHLALNVGLSGTFDRPLFKGDYQLSDGRLSIPLAGITLKKAALAGSFDESQITLDSWQIQSGAGQLKIDGQVRLDGWDAQEFGLRIRGQDVEVVDLPDLQATINPELKVVGDLSGVAVRGVVVIPELLYRGQSDVSAVRNSSDLVIVDDIRQKERKSYPVAVDVALTLGETVLVKANGLDAKLKGSLQLIGTSTDSVSGRGEISVDKGRYSSYGVSLDIERGNLIFTGEKIDNPGLDILALKTVDEVKAGVRITGLARQPVVTLYSEPTMSSSDVLSYIVLGRSMDQQGGDFDILTAAAGALLSQGESATLQEQLKGKLGLDVLNFSAGNGDIGEAVITTGKYLTPKLYLGFGYSLFKKTNETILRYSWTPRLELQSNIGIESGADLFYLFEIE